MQELAKRVFRVVRATAFLRVDFFYVPVTGEIVINEINTMPNLARGCMWFKLWAEADIAPEEWVRRVVEATLRQGEEKQRKSHGTKPDGHIVPKVRGLGGRVVEDCRRRDAIQDGKQG